MKLYRSKIPVIAKESIDRLIQDGDIEVEPANVEEAEADLVAIMEEFVRRDFELRERIKDHMARNNTPYSQYGRIRKRMAESWGHPLGDDIERYLVRQFVENLMISRFIEEVYAEDAVVHRKMMEIVRGHDVDEDALREEAAGKVKNVREGTVEYEVALRTALRDVKKRHGLV